MNYNNDNNIWDWQNEDYGLQTNASRSLWSNANENQGDLSCVLNMTPATSFWDFDHQLINYENVNAENINKESETCRESYSQAKRRKMLHFDDEVLGDVMPFCHEDLSYVYLKSKVRETLPGETLSNMTQWVTGFADDTSGSGNVGLDLPDQSSDGWLADCLVNNTEMHLNVDHLKPSGSTAFHIHLTGPNNSESWNVGGTVQELSTPRKNIIFKGKESFMKTPTKMGSSVVLPFAFVKPCGVQGAVTLKDINQKILTPPPSKFNKNATKSYPTSAFSGKPVVCKTKIHTEGGKGSITIMRTKG